MGLKVLMLAWEYPPRLVGGLARVVCAISQELTEQGCEVHVVTADHPGTPEYSIEDGVHVHRVKNQTGPDGEEALTVDFVNWIDKLNFGILQYAIKLHQESPFDVVHAHDWLVADAARTMKSFGIPVVSTIHATEFGRNRGGLNSQVSRVIDQIEWRLIYESRRVIVNSRHMFEEVKDHFQAPAEKVEIIPNGIDPNRFVSDQSNADLRAKHGIGEGPVVLFVGRIVEEKGIQVLLDAAPRVLERHPGTTFLIAGSGYYLDNLKQQADALGIAGNVKFFGQANDADLCELYTMADIMTVPSLYEPFGIVALEGMAAGLPTITSDTGGLMDIVQHMTNGLTTYTGDSQSVAWGLLQVLDDPEFADRIGKQGRSHVKEHFSWKTISARTLEMYQLAIAEVESAED